MSWMLHDVTSKCFIFGDWETVDGFGFAGMEQELASQLHAFCCMNPWTLWERWSEDPWCESMWQALASKVSPGIPDEDVDLRYEAHEGDELASLSLWSFVINGVWVVNGSHVFRERQIHKLMPGWRAGWNAKWRCSLCNWDAGMLWNWFLSYSCSML